MQPCSCSVCKDHRSPLQTRPTATFCPSKRASPPSGRAFRRLGRQQASLKTCGGSMARRQGNAMRGVMLLRVLNTLTTSSYTLTRVTTMVSSVGSQPCLKQTPVTFGTYLFLFFPLPFLPVCFKTSLQLSDLETIRFTFAGRQQPKRSSVKSISSFIIHVILRVLRSFQHSLHFPLLCILLYSLNTIAGYLRWFLDFKWWLDSETYLVILDVHVGNLKCKEKWIFVIYKPLTAL